MHCQSCGSTSLTLVLDLGQQPLCNALVSKDDLCKPEPSWPLKLYVCTHCWLVQLQKFTCEKEVFNKQYSYLSGSSRELTIYYQGFADELKKKLKINPATVIVDIGGNDGTLLQCFKDSTSKLLNIEPTPEPAKLSKQKGIRTMERFFSLQLAPLVGKANVVLAFNVLAHCDDIHDFLDGVHEVLTKEGVFINQSHYLPALVEQCQFDTIYHEHLRYYTLTSLIKLFKRHKFAVTDAQINTVYGGSILVHAKRLGSHGKQSEAIKRILKQEEKYRKLETYREFAQQVKTNAQKLTSYLSFLKKRGKRIVGVGAPMKASTLLNYCKIGPKTLDYLAEVNELKISNYSPGTHIPIEHERQLLHKHPDSCLLLSWNFAEEIIRKLRAQGYRGGFINPIPQFHTVNELTAFEDERGRIVDVLIDEQIEHVNHITFKAGAVRGNHYHKQSIHYHYVTKGAIDFYRQLPYGKLRIQTARAGDMVFTGMNERHALRALTDGEIMVFSRGPRGGTMYETDTFRLDEKEKLA